MPTTKEDQPHDFIIDEISVFAGGTRCTKCGIGSPIPLDGFDHGMPFCIGYQLSLDALLGIIVANKRYADEFISTT